ncbi:MAG: shikimate kinase [Alphaproteobacteria bacterium]
MTLPPTPPSPSSASDKTILARSIVLVGMMGSGKSSVGRKLAAHLSLPFADSDHEIAQAAGCTIAQFFERYGEAEFRAGERRVIARLLERPGIVLATGGGAFMQPETRALIQTTATSVWLKVDPAILTQRVGRRHDRPILQRFTNPAEGIAALLAEREPVYAQAHITVAIGDQAIETTVASVVQALSTYAAAAETAK